MTLQNIILSLTLIFASLALPAYAQEKPNHADYAASNEIIALIKSYEKLRLKPYKGASGKWVIGYGRLLGKSHNGPITTTTANAYLKKDIEDSENIIKRLVKTDLSQHEFDALVSLAFNIGSGAFAKSTVRKRLNQGNKQGAGDAFLMWNRAGGKKNKHLTERRQQERAYFFGETVALETVQSQ